jgi:hypothetical protein
MVRLVFRPYTQVRRTICTSVSLRASTRVSSGFTLLRHSSPSFGSRHTCSTQTLRRRSRSVGRACPSLSLRTRAYKPGYSHTCQTPWSVFLDGSVAPVPSAGAPIAPPRAPRKCLGARTLAPSGRPLTHQLKVHRRQPHPKAALRSAQRLRRTTAESSRRRRAQPGFLLPISSTL